MPEKAPKNPRRTVRRPTHQRRRPVNRHQTHATIHRLELRTRAVLLRLASLLAIGLVCYLVYIYFVVPYTPVGRLFTGMKTIPRVIPFVVLISVIIKAQ